MSADDERLDRLVEIVRQDGQARAVEMANLNRLLEERTQVLERQLGKRANAAKWYAVLAGLLAVMVGVWVYSLMLEMSRNVGDMSTHVGQMQVYMKNLGGGESGKGAASFMSGMAHDTDQISVDIGIMRKAMQQVTGDIGAMRTVMEGVRVDIGSMNGIMGNLGGDMRLMSDDVAGMARSMGHMNRSVDSLARGADALRAPFPTMDSVMPWR